MHRDEFTSMSIGDLVGSKRVYEERINTINKENEALKAQIENEKQKRLKADSLKEEQIKENHILKQIIQEKEVAISSMEGSIKVATGEKNALKKQLDVKNGMLKEKLDEASQLKLRMIKLEKKNDKIIQMLDQKMDSILNKTDESLKTIEIIQRKDISKEVLDCFEESKEEMVNSFEKNSGEIEEMKERINEMKEEQAQERQQQKALLEIHKVIIEQMKEERISLINGIKGALGIKKECNMNDIIEEVMKLKQKKTIIDLENRELKRDMERMEKEMEILKEKQKDYAEVICLAEGILKRELKK
ncbi:myosin heavy chain, clone, putative [Entamoeba dispar SAW760]|uniref:Myosin heavy chain, clone, putative n=1 Tax=Entamoeba dispar (strain ATCC PRA-260 / SAW760) TaxID=370354 RepID=B0ECG8_ENTDS|nr:myosin heavy chain, clone, putative [Entamoeba dispar SAW760]EDR27777.1 myosin heavy chain, clone, putative [Entamoeba dispar SAW760]|eukprot:EDR27777.1 myosin heavy chain, clone, putative [Entamoeba dispar SAW760]